MGGSYSPRGSTSFSGIALLGIAIVLLFAVVGVVSAGSFVTNKISGSSATATPKPATTAGNAAVQDVKRAQTQATAIVSNAQVAGRRIVAAATTKANKKASKIVANAQRTAPGGSPTAVSGGSSTQPQTAPVTGATVVPFATSQAGAVVGAQPPVDLSRVPASWKVVGYNARFGSGPGTAGSITVTNRSGATFSGTARVVYKSGGAATGFFGRLAPGQTATIPLNGRSYPGGGYTILVNPH